jgi:uncharacterized Zn-finger protein
LTVSAVNYADVLIALHKNRETFAVTHPTDAADSSLENANTLQEYEVSRKDLPHSCPTPEQKLWNSHPRVYLPIEETGTAVCPYCSARYRLVD